ALRELRQLRRDGQSVAELPSSPFLDVKEEQAGQSSVQSDAIECDQTQPDATESAEMQNEATDPALAASSVAADGCDACPAENCHPERIREGSGPEEQGTQMLRSTSA